VQAHETSNFQETDNLVLRTEELSEWGCQNGKEIFVITNNLPFMNTVYKGHSTPPKLTEIILCLCVLQPTSQGLLHVIRGQSGWPFERGFLLREWWLWGLTHYSSSPSTWMQMNAWEPESYHGSFHGRWRETLHSPYQLLICGLPFLSWGSGPQALDPATSCNEDGDWVFPWRQISPPILPPYICCSPCNYPLVM
jgi:hypothetical protein